MEGRHYPKATREEIEQLLADTRDHREKARRSLWRRVGQVLYTLLLVVLAAVLIALTVTRLQGGSPSLLGYRVFVVQSESMAPTLPVGSVIVVRALGEKQLPEVGDVVTFTHEGMTITHRIVEIRAEDGHPIYLTRGDNPQNSVDPWTITAEDIVGVLVFRLAMGGGA